MTITKTNFDDIPFDILVDRSTRTAVDWTITPVQVREQVPYSNITVVEHIGFEPARVTWTLLFDRRRHFYAFAARLGTTGTLTLPAGVQSLRGRQYTYDNPPGLYDILDQVTIESIATPSFYPRERVRVEVTFGRAVDPVTREAVVP